MGVSPYETRLKKVEVLLDIQLDRMEMIETKLSELVQNQAAIIQMVDSIVVMNRMLADQEETRREVEQN